MQPKTITYACICYLIWGTQALYWNLFSGFSSAFVLIMRISMSFFVTLVYLGAIGKPGEIKAVLCDKRKMRFMLPASAFLAADWAFFIWGVGHGHVIDCNIGYYLNPLVLFLFGVILFKESLNNWEKTAVIVACAGVVIFVFMTGELPVLSLFSAVLFPTYAMLKKLTGIDPIVGICTETMLMTPFALLYGLLFLRGAGGFGDVMPAHIPLLLGCGIITAFPMILYNLIVNLLPMKFVGMMQYVGTTLSMIIGVTLLHEEMTPGKAVITGCVIAGVVLFTIGNSKKAAGETETAEEPDSH